MEISTSEGCTRIDLKNLRPLPRSSSVIDGITKRRLWITGIGLILIYYALPVTFPETITLIRDNFSYMGFLAAKATYLVCALLLLAAAHFWRKYFDVVEFEYEPGRTAFDVIASRSNNKDFISFVDAISSNIRSAAEADAANLPQ